MSTIEEKLDRLKAILADCDGVVVAYSGGVDSTLLARVALDVLGDRVLAVTACSETYPDQEVAAALIEARQMGIRHTTIQTDELANESFATNPPDRCYFCKTELFGKLREMAREHGLRYVLDGANHDDQFDHRPGLRAGRELGVRSPLKEAGLTKDDIRQLSKELGLPTWDKPSFACLASRFPYGERITQEKLNMIGQAEDFLRSLGIGQLRVRHHRDLARIEVNAADFTLVVAASSEVARRLKELGYTYVTLDLQGYRTGSMNEVLE